MTATPTPTNRIDLEGAALPAPAAAPLITVADAATAAPDGLPAVVVTAADQPALAEAVAVDRRHRQSTRKWTPPHRVWHVYLLILLTFGAYAVVWSYRFAGDFRRHRKRQVRPWLHPVGMLASLGLATPLIVWRHARWIRRLNREIQHRPWPGPVAIAIGCSAIFATGLALIVANQLGALQGRVSLGLGLAVWLLLPLPWVVMQRHLNIFKASRPDGPWSDPPYRLRLAHYLGMAAGLLLIGLAGHSLVQQFAPRTSGDILAAGVPVTGSSGGYGLVPTAAFWVRARPGTLADGADLELIGPSLDTQVVVTVHPGGDWTLDRLTRDRRAQLRRQARALVDVSEERVLLPGRLYQRSDARYVVIRDGVGIVYQVVTIVGADRAVELVAFTPETNGHTAEIEAIAGSFALP